MITIQKTANYFQKFFKGEWKGNTFTLADYNGNIYVMFDEYVDIPESEHSKLIQDIINEYKK